MGSYKENKVSMESAKHAGHVWAHFVTQAQKLACMHNIFLPAWTHNSAEFDQIKDIKASMEYQDYFHIFGLALGG